MGAACHRIIDGLVVRLVFARIGARVWEITSPRLLPSAFARRFSSRRTDASRSTVVRGMMRDVA
jgi:hypothetical protein